MPARTVLLVVLAVLTGVATPAQANAPSFTRVQEGPVLQPTHGFYDDCMLRSSDS